MEHEREEICSIRLAFPVKSDEQAIEYKRKITSLLAEIPDAQIQFSLTSMPVKKGYDGNMV